MRSEEVRAALAATYRQPEWAIFFEVADGTGASKRRSADAVAVNMWPSRGLAITGFEIKVDRSDWRRELANPAKAESIARYCDFWYVAAPKGLIEPATLPMGWGLIEVEDEGKTRMKVQPKEQKSAPISRSFFAALCRSRSQQDEHVVKVLVDKALASAREEDRRSMDRRIAERARDATAIMEKHAAFSKAFGNYGPLSHMKEDEIVEGLAMLHDLGILKGWGPLRSLITQVKSTAKALEAIEVEYLKPKEAKS